MASRPWLAGPLLTCHIKLIFFTRTLISSHRVFSFWLLFSCFDQSNVPIGRVEIYKGAISEIPRCHCRPDSDHPCGPDSDCINRLMMYECDSSVCPAGENCQNQRLQRHLDVDAMPFRTPSRGWGLKTKVDIEKVVFMSSKFQNTDFFDWIFLLSY